MHGLFLEVFPQYHKTLTRGRRGNQQVKQDHQSAMMVYDQLRRSSQEYSGDYERQNKIIPQFAKYHKLGSDPYLYNIILYYSCSIL